MISRKYRWAHYRIYRKPVSIKMCGNTLMAAVTLRKQPAPLGQSCLWNSCHISWANTHRSIRKHLPNNSSASIRHQQQPKQGPSAGAQSPGWAQEQQQSSTNTAQRGNNKSSRLSFGGATVVPGMWGVRGGAPGWEVTLRNCCGRKRLRAHHTLWRLFSSTTQSIDVAVHHKV